MKKDYVFALIFIILICHNTCCQKNNFVNEANRFDEKHTKSIINSPTTEHVQSPFFDKIIVSSSGCLGPCPIYSISISANGDVLYDGEYSNEFYGLFNSKMAFEEFQNIESKFKKPDVDKLQRSYSINATDSNEVTVTFVKKDKIYKTVRDYGSQSPLKFRMFYDSIINEVKQLTLKNVGKKMQFPYNRLFGFKSGNKIIRLEQSESFYLYELLKSAQVCNAAFKTFFTINYHNQEQLTQIETDGRYYAIALPGQKCLTLDIGYNFIVRNNLMSRLSKKESYE
jgi:hypothetical protein